MPEKFIEKMFGEQRCKYEFGQCILSRVKEPATKFEPRMQRVIFLGFAPNVTNGFWVMRSDNKVELTSNIADETVFDEAIQMPERKMYEQKLPGQPNEDDIYPQNLFDDIMGPAGAQ